LTSEIEGHKILVNNQELDGLEGIHDAIVDHVDRKRFVGGKRPVTLDVLKQVIAHPLFPIHDALQWGGNDTVVRDKVYELVRDGKIPLVFQDDLE
jgi:hypothetical protein